MSTPDLDLQQLREGANRHLFELIHQLMPSASWDSSDNSVACGDLPLKAACLDVWANERGDIFSLEFGLLLKAEGNLVIRERAAGFGASIDEALRFAVMAWVTTVFVTGACLYDPEGHPGHMASMQERALPDGEGRNRIWQIASSPATGFSLSQKGQKKSAESLETLPTLEPAVGGLAKIEAVHWIKVFVANNPDGFDIECTRNNDRAPEIDSLFVNFPWPNPEMKYIRQFHIMKPTDRFAAQPDPLPQRAIQTPPVEKKKLFGFLSRK